MILVDAMYINKGGGAVLLRYLIEAILAHPRGGQFFFMLDPRFEKPAALDGNFVVIPNKMSERKRFYKKRKDEFSKVFCFANTPPPVKFKVPVYTYFHNQKLLEAPQRILNRDYLKPYLKYLVVKRFNRNTDKYIVQTKHMVDELVKVGLKDQARCLMIPFYDDRKYKSEHTPFDKRSKDEFVFISNPSPQKNYPTLLDAWEYLLEQGHTPKLHVTVDDTGPEYVTRIDELNKRGARIQNHVYVDPKELYFNCPYLIFPSVVESFGLPLIEAADSGMKILASDLPYVYDVVTPSLTFQPYDKISIADAVRKAMTSDIPFPALVAKNEINKLMDLLVG